MAKIIMHIDLNAFFVSCEILKNPSLKNKPIAVGGDVRRGVISTASYEARKYGVNSAQPIYQAKKLCKDLIILPVDFKFYKQKSKEFFSYIQKNVTDKIEMASIDEAFVDLSDVLINVDDPYNYLKNLQNELLKVTGLGCSIGIGTTKFIAKMASDYKKPMGLTIIHKKDIKKMLFPLPIKDLYGVGKKSQEKLLALQIKTIGDYYYYNPEVLKKINGKMYYTLKNWLEGKGDDEVITYEVDPKSISTSQTFMFDTSSYEEIEEVIIAQAKEISNSLKKRNMLALTLQITIRYNDFKTITRSKTYEEPFVEEHRIIKEALNLFEKYYNGNEVRLVGVGVSSLKSKDNYFEQISLFNMAKHQEECKTKILINKLNNKLDKKVFMTLNEYKRKKEEK